MSLSKYIKNTSLGMFGIVAGAGIYYHSVIKLREKSVVKEEEDINEIIFTQSPGNYNTPLTQGIQFVCGPPRFAAEVLINLILSAQESIYVSMPIFTSNLLAWALIAAHNNGVDVKCFVDASMENANSSKVQLLREVGIPVKAHDAKTLHLKLCVIDVPFGNKKKKTTATSSCDVSFIIPPNGVIITGSLNWTREALMSNEENFIVTSNAKICQSSAKKFHEIWNNSCL